MIGIICAMELELEGILGSMQIEDKTEISGITYVRGLLGSRELVVAQCGVGKVNCAVCTQIMIDKFSPDAIINSGVAGALSEDVTVGDVVIASYAVQHDYDTTALGEEKGLVDCSGELMVKIPMDETLSKKLYDTAKALGGCNVFMGIIATGDRFVSDSDERLSIGEEFSALACEMEGGAMAQVCRRAKLPCAIIRSISDDIGHNTSMSFDEFKVMAAEKTVDILKMLF